MLCRRYHLNQRSFWNAVGIRVNNLRNYPCQENGLSQDNFHHSYIEWGHAPDECLQDAEMLNFELDWFWHLGEDVQSHSSFGDKLVTLWT